MVIFILRVLWLVGIVFAFIVFGVVPAIRAYFTFRGKRLVICPETEKTETVDVAEGFAALTAAYGQPKLCLEDCTRWPERNECNQECLRQVQADPQQSRVWNIVSTWYNGKKCVYCRKRFDPLKHLDHAPALLAPDGITMEWKEFRPEQLPNIFSTYKPVCWNCHTTQTFRRVHPELVIDRHRDIRLPL